MVRNTIKDVNDVPSFMKDALKKKDEAKLAQMQDEIKKATGAEEEEPEVCDAPTGLRASDVTSSSAILDWAPLGSESLWEIDLDGETRSVAIHPYTISGLTELTTYNVRVRAVCGSESRSDWSSMVSFTTLRDTVVIDPPNRGGKPAK